MGKRRSKQHNSDDFDPYREWLGIPDDQRPPTLYQLLGISPSEEKHSVIETAAARQSQFVHDFRGGEYDELAAQILFEIEDARITLLNTRARLKYDNSLRQKDSRDSQPTRVVISGDNKLVGEGAEFVRSYFGIVSVLVVAFIVTAAASFMLPWGKLDKKKPVEPVQNVAGRVGELPQKARPVEDVLNDKSLTLELLANADGSLRQAVLNNVELGGSDAALDKLKFTVVQFAKNREQSEIRIIPDLNLQFGFVHDALRHCAGELTADKTKWNKRIKFIRLATPAPNAPAAVPRDTLIFVNEGGKRFLPSIFVKMHAKNDGSMRELLLGRRLLGNDDAAFRALNFHILKIIGRPNNPVTLDMSVRIVADRSLRYSHVVKAINASGGALNPAKTDWLTYIYRIGFENIGVTQPLGE